MNVGVLIVTHNNIGDIVLRTAVNVIGACPLHTRVLTAPPGCEPDRILDEARAAVQELDAGAGVLVLCDAFGATPCNIACRLYEPGRVHIVSGFNLPMALKVLNYPRLSLEELESKAISGGRDGVQTCRAG
jgi:PTS system ascorbate-specific IIA component